MAVDYVELHARSFYSFGEGASHSHELLARAKAYGCTALALTDSNLCGALEFTRLANSLGVQPITGGELTLTDGSRLVLLAKTRAGYANVSRLFTLANAADRREPRLDPAHLQGAHRRRDPADRRPRWAPRTAGAGRVPAGGRGAAGPLPGVVRPRLGVRGAAAELPAGRYRSQPRTGGDSRGRQASRWWPPTTSSTTDPERYRLQHALAAARRNTTIDRALPFIKPNDHFCTETAGRDGTALPGASGGHRQHVAHRRSCAAST